MDSARFCGLRGNPALNLRRGFSRCTVTRIFEDEQGVLVIERPETMHKRRYRSIRIPRHVYEQVVAQFTVG